jgi:predicted TIM-barrel fold metal-dependent hydrolase
MDASSAGLGGGDPAQDCEPPLVDAHVHVFPEGLPYRPNAHARPDYAHTVEDYLATLDRHGVHFGVIAAMSLTGYYNDYVIESLRAHRRLRGTVYVPPRIGRADLREMADVGVVGVRLFRGSRSFGAVEDLTTHEYRVLLRRIRDLDWHVQVIAMPDLLEPTLEVLSKAGVKIVVDHFGFADPDLLERSPHYGALLRSVDLGRTWIKISAGYRLTRARAPRAPADYERARAGEHRLAAFFLDKCGTDRLIWGSDAPFVGHEGAVTYQQRIDSYLRAIPSGATRRAIDRTALKFYFD